MRAREVNAGILWVRIGILMVLTAVWVDQCSATPSSTTGPFSKSQDDGNRSFGCCFVVTACCLEKAELGLEAQCSSSSNATTNDNLDTANSKGTTAWVKGKCPTTVKEAVEIIDGLGSSPRPVPASPPSVASTAAAFDSTAPLDSNTEGGVTKIILIVLCVLIVVAFGIWLFRYRQGILLRRKQREQATNLSLELELGPTQSQYGEEDEGRMHLMQMLQSDDSPVGGNGGVATSLSGRSKGGREQIPMIDPFKDDPRRLLHLTDSFDDSDDIDVGQSGARFGGL